MPDGFGAAYNLFSTAKELLLQVECGSSSNATLTVGNGQSTIYIYRFGYEWVNGSWKQIALSGQQLAGQDWYIGTASANLVRSQAQLAEDNFVVAYTCLWQNNSWRCGCRDQICSQNYWQLQAFKQAPPPTGGGGSGSEGADEPASPFPSDLSTGHQWVLDRSWNFEGKAGSPPPEPWHNGLGWGNTEVNPWRQALYLDEYAALTGNGALKLSMDYDPSTKLCKTAYLVSNWSGNFHTRSDQDYKIGPTAKGVWIEARVKFPSSAGNSTIPDWTVFGWWMLDPTDPVSSPRQEIDILEYPGIEAYKDWFVSNTHGGGSMTSPYEGKLAKDAPYPSYPSRGGYVQPSQHFPGNMTDPGDGQWHTWSLFWSKTEQRFYYDGHMYWKRVAGPQVKIHERAQDLRVTVECKEDGWGSTISREESWAKGEWNGDPHVLIDYVRVYKRQ